MSNMNEPAFPIIDEAPGLTKLEWAAVQIMAGLEANPVLDMSSEACAAVAV